MQGGKETTGVDGRSEGRQGGRDLRGDGEKMIRGGKAQHGAMGS